MKPCDGSVTQKWLFKKDAAGSSLASLAKQNMCVHTGKARTGTLLVVSSCMTPRPANQIYRHFVADFDPTAKDENGNVIANANGQIVGNSGQDSHAESYGIA